MLRWLVLVLLLANAGCLAWSQHWLAGLGLAPATESEPGRLGQQIEPEALRVLPGQGSKNANGSAKPTATATTNDAAAVTAAFPSVAAAPAAEAPAASAPPEQAAAAPAGPLAAVVVPAAGAPAAGLAAAPTAAERGECLRAGPFDTAEANAWRRAASALPQGSWSLERSTTPGRWMVYLGRFADADALARKRAELRARNISYDRTGVAALDPGLSLGRFSSEEAAERALATLNRKNGDALLRTARVVVEREEAVRFQLRLPLVDSALRTQLSTLRPALAGHALQSCF